MDPATGQGVGNESPRPHDRRGSGAGSAPVGEGDRPDRGGEGAEGRASFGRRFLLGGILAALVLVAGAAGYQQLFSSFADYDDEGYIMLSLRQFMGGKPLYDGVYSQYGPAYYFTQAGFHALTGCPVTHDAARWKTLAVWLLTAFFAAAATHRLTRRPWLALLAFPVVFCHLDRFGVEPGHPQDLVAPVVAAILWVAAEIGGSGGRAWLVGMLGVLAGTLAGVKINVGVVAAAAVGGAFLGTVARRAGRNGGLAAVAVVAAVLWAAPVGVAWAGGLSLAWVPLPVAMTVGFAGLLPLAWSGNNSARSGRTIAVFVAALLGTVLVFSALAVVDGTTVPSLAAGLLGQSWSVMALFYRHPPLPVWSLAFSAVVVLLLPRLHRRPVWARWVKAGAAAVLGAVLVVQSYEAFTRVTHGLTDRSLAGVLLALATPLACLLLLPRPEQGLAPAGGANPARGGSAVCGFGRQVLAWSVVLFPATVYPMPGTQVAIATLPALVALFVLTADAVEAVRRQAWPWPRRVAGGLAAAALALCLLSLGCRLALNAAYRDSCRPLGLRGVRLLRLPAAEGERHRFAVRRLRALGGTFVTVPTGYCSYYLWAGIAPPTGFNATAYDLLLSPAQQAAVIQALERDPQAGVLLDPARTRTWFGQSPLSTYLRCTFTRCLVADPVEIWVRPAFRPK